MLGRHGMFLELNEDVEDYEDLTEIMSNVQLNSNFLALAREVRTCTEITQYLLLHICWSFIFSFYSWISWSLKFQMTSTKLTWRTTVRTFFTSLLDPAAVYQEFNSFSVSLRVWRQWITGGLRSHESGFFIRQRLCQRSIRSRQTAHRGWKQVAVQEQGPRWESLYLLPHLLCHWLTYCE